MSIVVHHLNSMNDETHFSHNSPLMALTYLYAQKHNLLSQFSNNVKKMAEKVKPLIRKGNHGYHLGDWSIVFKDDYEPIDGVS